MKRVVLTGASGFIGRACLRPLAARGFEVHAVYHSGTIVDSPGVSWHRCDLLGDAPGIAALLRELAPSHLLHLAWYAAPGKYWTARENLSWVRASLALYEAFGAAGGKRAVCAGTCAEYDWADGTCRERVTPIAPRTYYGIAKHALDAVLAADAARAGTSVAWARFFFLYGEHEPVQRLISSVVVALLRGEAARCSPGSQVRDFLHVADAAAATVALLDSPVTGPVNIGSGVGISVRALAERIVTLIGGPGRLELGSLPPDPDPRVVADIARLRDEVGFTAAGELEARLDQTIDWWKRNLP